MILITEKGEQYEREFVWWVKTDNRLEDRILMRFLSPADIRGTGLLTYENKEGRDDQWFYHPATRRIRRISSGDRRNRFMGTEFLYEDLQSHHVKEHSYRCTGLEKIEGEVCDRIEENPLPEYQSRTSYGKKILWIGTKTYHLRKVDYFNREGKRWKTLEVNGVMEIQPGIYREESMVMINHFNGRRTILSLKTRTVNPVLTEELFSQRYLRKRLEKEEP